MLLIFLFTSLISCGENRKVEENINSGLKLDWLLGDWTRTNDEAGNQTFEVWRRNSEGVLEGKGWTIRDNETVFQENMRIAQTGSDRNFEVRGVNEQPTFFRITKSSKESFTAENEQNDFPKKIQYSIEDKKLKAVISDDENEVEFIFRRSTD